MGGRSLLEWNLRWLLDAGMAPVWVNLHYRAAEVRGAVESMDLPPDSVRFSPENPILGTAGAWRRLAREWDGTSLVVYGDNLTRFDLAAFVAAHRAVRERDRSGGGPHDGGPHDGGPGRALATVALFDPSRHVNTGIAGSRVLVTEDGMVAGFQEVRGGEAGSSLVSTGACLLEPGLADLVGPGFSDFGAQVFPELVRQGALSAHVIEAAGFCLGLDTPAHFEAGTRLVEDGRVCLR